MGPIFVGLIFMGMTKSIKLEVLESKYGSNPFALFNTGKAQVNCTNKIIEVIENLIHKVTQYPSININDFSSAFYSKLHWQIIGKDTAYEHNHLIDLDLQAAVNQLRHLEKRYPASGMGDTMTDEMIVYYTMDYLIETAKEKGLALDDIELKFNSVNNEYYKGLINTIIK
jgi:hypothetical protein